MYDLVSEDQMRSAFEIADTNGDGVLTYTEAIEVNSNSIPGLLQCDFTRKYFSLQLKIIIQFIDSTLFNLVPQF